jgi:hypothetical protein
MLSFSKPLPLIVWSSMPDLHIRLNHISCFCRASYLSVSLLRHTRHHVRVNCITELRAAINTYTRVAGGCEGLPCLCFSSILRCYLYWNANETVEELKNYLETRKVFFEARNLPETSPLYTIYMKRSEQYYDKYMAFCILHLP